MGKALGTASLALYYKIWQLITGVRMTIDLGWSQKAKWK